ncbi:iron-containing alcohol dehydrogenase [Pseudomonas sp. NFACC45]|uniref:iron-containing alcohol dehydrogenase n=1 Tax=Pseudomonas sp. NFACC45 TaxID=1566201 RepID=UPI0008E68B16|nr:iron-containing alcohol dehydrogenase [Pseudomonas sp. NFACC45]SFG85943.1 Alcohol dehydrogenase, class IV [Pseudomonas sp. NFACC45]
MQTINSTFNSQQFSADWSYPTPIWFGVERISELVNGCVLLGKHRPLVVIDTMLVEHPLIVRALERCSQAGIDLKIFSSFRSDPDTEMLDRGIGIFNESARDSVIGIGGGSALDLAKAIAFMAVQTKPIWTFESLPNLWKAANDNLPPIISVPTTAGTGAEVGRAAVLLDTLDNRKRLIFHPKMLSSLVIVDPALTLTVPASISAAVGIDAFSHAFEAYCANGFHPMGDGIALQAMCLIKQWLPIVFREGSNLQARCYLSAAALMGAVAFHKGLGAVHAVSHSIGGVYGTHHGLTNGVLLPYVVAYNRPVIEDKLVRLSENLNLLQPGYESFVTWLREFLADLGIPSRLSQIIHEPFDSEYIAQLATADPTARTNPQTLSQQHYKTIIDNAWFGR